MKLAFHPLCEVLLLCCLFTIPCFAADDKPLADEKIAEIGKLGTALVEMDLNGQERGFGSAFCVDQHGYFVTNNHVVGHAGMTIKLIVAPGEKSQKSVSAKVLRTDSQLDLALLKIDEPGMSSPLDMGTDEGLSEVQEVIAFGFPFGKELALNAGDYPSISVNKGRITALRKKDGKLNRIQIDAVVNPGNSGGPIIDHNGHVVGVVVSGVMGAGAVNFAIPISHVRGFLHKPDVEVVAPQITAQNVHAEAELLVKVASFFKSDYTVDLCLKDTNGCRTLKPNSVHDDCYTFKFVPVAENPDPTVELTAVFSAGSISGRTEDHAIKIGERSFKLSEIRRIELNPPNVVLLSGEKVAGELKDLANFKISVGAVQVQADLTKAVSIGIKPPERGTRISYTAAVNYEGTSIEACGTLSIGADAGGGTLTVAAGTAEPAAINPLPMNEASTELKLPSTIDDLAVGGGGRYLILHLPKLHKLAIFDANKGAISNYISVPENIVFAAGLTKVMVCVLDSNIIQRYNLETCEREVSVQSPVTGSIRLASMGASSEGPLLISVSLGTQDLDRVSYHLIDIAKMSAEPLKPKITGTGSNVYSTSYRDFIHARASADGSVFGFWCTSHSPSGLESLSIVGNEAVGHYEHDSRGHVIPGFDGTQIFTCGAIYTTELKKIQGNFQDGITYIPSPQSGYFIGMPGAMYPFNNDTNLKREIFVYGPGDSRVLVKIPNVSSLGKIDPWAKSDFTLDKRYHLLTRSNVLITIPEQNDRLVLYHFDLLEALKSSNVDYLFVSSNPPRSAFKDRLLTYKIGVESKAGALKYTLDSGPKGMQLSADGELTWTPHDEDGDVGVIVRISDKSGQEIFHSFNVRVR